MSNQCLICGQEMKIIPAGVSQKTGKPYNSFSACPNKCKQPNTYNQTGANNTFDKSYKIIQDKKIEGMYNEKKDNIKWLNALNNATLLVAHKVVTTEPGKVFDTIQIIARKYYTSEAPKNFTQEAMPTIQVPEEDYSQPEINPDNIPF